MGELSTEQAAQVFEATRVHGELAYEYIARCLGQDVVEQYVTEFKPNNPPDSYLFREPHPYEAKITDFRRTAALYFKTVSEYRLYDTNASNMTLASGYLLERNGLTLLRADLQTDGTALVTKKVHNMNIQIEAHSRELDVEDDDLRVITASTDRLKEVNTLLGFEIDWIS